MAEQMHISREQPSRRRRGRTGQAEQQENGDVQRTIEEQLSKLDAAFDEYLEDTSKDDSIVAGQSQSHLLSRPLSNEALVRGFRQTRGE